MLAEDQGVMTKVISIFGDRDPREVPLYTIGQAARYLRLPPSTVRAWSVGADYPVAHGRDGRFRQLLDVPDGTPVRLTFNNLVEAYVLRVMRRLYDVPMSHVRRALDNVSESLGVERPLLSSNFETDGVRLYLNEVNALQEVSTGKGRQLAIPDVIRNGLRRIERDEHGIVRLFPYAEHPDEDRAVSIDPRRSFGRPTVEGSGVTVDIVADLIEAGETPAAVAREFGITKDAVNSAVKWYRRLAA